MLLPSRSGMGDSPIFRPMLSLHCAVLP